MSLIKCPECGKEISDKATICVNCGYPIQQESIEKELHTNSHQQPAQSCPIQQESIEKECYKKYVYLCMSNYCLSQPFKEFDDYVGEARVCPDCDAPLKYLEEQIIDAKTDLVVKCNSNNKDITHSKQLYNDNIPKCPICQSTNLSKISSLGKAAKIGLFGIFGAGDIGKTWKCNNCGSKF